MNGPQWTYGDDILMRLDEYESTRPEHAIGAGVGVAPGDERYVLIVYRARYGLRVRLEMGSLEMETDGPGWPEQPQDYEGAKQVAEVMLRHALAFSWDPELR
jgi:hypothetical protein